MFTSRGELIKFMSQQKFDKIGDHDGDGVAGEGDMSEHADPAIAEANAMVMTIFNGKGFTHDQLEILARDPVLRRAASKIAADALCCQKTELIRDDGTSLYTRPANDALKLFKSMAMADQRSSAERVAGSPTIVRSRSTTVTPKFYVSPSRNDPKGPGGFVIPLIFFADAVLHAVLKLA